MIALFIGAWAWVVVFFKKGPKALLGHTEIVVHHFENAVVYNKGAFNRILQPGVHWLRLRSPLLIGVDMRPEVFQIAQGVVTSDRFPAVLRCAVRIQVRNPRAAIESGQNYRNEVYARLQSVVKMIGKKRSLKELHADHDELNAIAQKNATSAIVDIGCECIGFELLQTDSPAGPPDLESNKIGFSDRLSDHRE
jgi:hypothetical protein